MLAYNIFRPAGRIETITEIISEESGSEEDFTRKAQKESKILASRAHGAILASSGQFTPSSTRSPEDIKFQPRLKMSTFESGPHHHNVKVHEARVPQQFMRE